MKCKFSRRDIDDEYFILIIDRYFLSIGEVGRSVCPGFFMLNLGIKVRSARLHFDLRLCFLYEVTFAKGILARIRIKDFFTAES